MGDIQNNDAMNICKTSIYLFIYFRRDEILHTTIELRTNKRPFRKSKNKSDNICLKEVVFIKNHGSKLNEIDQETQYLF